jgi:hypothetical protein
MGGHGKCSQVGSVPKRRLFGGGIVSGPRQRLFGQWQFGIGGSRGVKVRPKPGEQNMNKFRVRVAGVGTFAGRLDEGGLPSSMGCIEIGG